MNAMDQVWNRITDELKGEVNETSMDIFLNSIHPSKMDENTLVLEARNDFCKEWVERKYTMVLKKILTKISPQMSFRFIIKPQTFQKDVRPYQPGLPGAVAHVDAPTPVAEKQISQVKSSSGHQKGDFMFNAKYTFDSFIVGKSNQFVHAICQAICAEPGTKYNPVFIHGGVGLGKTHLLQAVGQHIIAGNPKAKVAYLSSEAFTNEFIDSIKDRKANEFRAKFRKKDILLIDDVQFLAGKGSVIEEFFHTFNELFQNKKQIVLSSDSPPKKINNLEDRLVSRFEMGIVADVLPPDLEMRAAIIKTSAARMSMKVPDEYIMYLAQNVNSNIRELEGAFLRVVAYAGIVQKNISRELIDQVLKDFFRENPTGKITIEYIQKKVAEYFDIPESEMTSKRRAANVVFPRQIAMRLAQVLTSSPLSQIGAAFGGRDHTTVIHSIDKIETMIKKDSAFSEEFQRIKRFVAPQSV
ncbi:MAG: chromosomal replication initiator protein DnaA [Candidatus Riflebacteria bacterium]|nr:chromosomal replication initiator protein DnaA [Candidatus Riflebacteria bacterium]